MLDKRLVLGGLQVGGPRTAQNPARFRVANNVFQTKDGYVVPRAGNKTYLAKNLYGRATVAGESVSKVVGVTRYKDEAVILAVDTNGKSILFKDAREMIPDYEMLAPSGDISIIGSASSIGPQYLENLGCLFIHSLGALYKYDGTQVYKAGVPLPFFSSPQFDQAGAVFVRVIQHKIDFQGNVVNSGYVQFPATPNGSDIINLRVDRGAMDIIGTNATVSPRVRPVGEKLNDQYDRQSFFATSKAFSGSDVIFTTGGDHKVTVGAYVFIYVANSQPIPFDENGTNQDIHVLALKVKSFDATTVTLSLINAKYFDSNSNWEFSSSITSSDNFWSTISILAATNYSISTWTSNAATGNYVYKATLPVYFYSNAPRTVGFIVGTPTSPSLAARVSPYNLAGNLGDIYDVTSVKQVLQVSLETARGVPSFTTFGELALMGLDTLVLFSDTTLGGAFEMTNGLGFIAVGDGDDGNIMSVCGSTDFFLVSMQYRNYYISGNLPTANYRVQAINETSLGAYSPESAISVEGLAIFLNKQGVWAVAPGGKCTELTFSNQGIFESFAGVASFSEESYYELDDYPVYVDKNAEDTWIRSRHDVNRGLVFFIKKGSGTLEALVLNLSNGEFYTWSNLGVGVTDLAIINGIYYATNNISSIATLLEEDRTNYAYMLTSPVKLETTWFTAGEPSLEKKLNQIKMWGVVPSADISHYLDWITSSSIYDGQHVNDILGAFSHKKGLVPANFQSVSVAMAFSEYFQLEGLEIEFSPLQQGMKR